jgi:hypothetical protein
MVETIPRRDRGAAWIMWNLQLIERKMRAKILPGSGQGKQQFGDTV